MTRADLRSTEVQTQSVIFQLESEVETDKQYVSKKKNFTPALAICGVRIQSAAVVFHPLLLYSTDYQVPAASKVANNQH